MPPVSGFFDPARAHGNVVFNFRHVPARDLAPFAVGYRVAGRRLAERMAADSSYADNEGYPVLFLYRHSIELYLKAIIYEAAQMMALVDDDMVRRIPNQHSLQRLLQPVGALLRAVYPDTPIASFNEYLDLHTLVADIEAIDDKSESFRYPISTSGRAILDRGEIVNVLLFAERSERSIDFLDSVHLQLALDFQESAAVRYEVEQFLQTL